MKYRREQDDCNSARGHEVASGQRVEQVVEGIDVPLLGSVRSDRDPKNYVAVKTGVSDICPA